MKFEWDSNKEQINIKKHHISFKTAELVFGDENRLEIFDEEHSIDEDRIYHHRHDRPDSGCSHGGIYHEGGRNCNQNHICQKSN